MKHGVHEPFRFNERVGDNGLWTYDAITYLSFEGDEATASGMTDNLKLSHTRELRNYLLANGVRRFMHYARGRKVIYTHDGKRWRMSNG